MALPSKKSPRTTGNLTTRVKELVTEQRRLNARIDFYSDLDSMGADELTAKLSRHRSFDRYQPAMMAHDSNMLMAELLEISAGLENTSRGIANQKINARIGIISDLFLYRSFQGLADFVPITPHNYQEHTNLDVLLVVSTWRGIDGVSWRGVTQRTSPLRQLLLTELIPFFRARDIPVVFYSKEDPPNYRLFLEFAQQADVIFTSAQEMIPRYENDAPQAKSYDALSFGINPLVHSPIGSRIDSPTSIITFAGTWFTKKYQHRRRWGSALLDAVMSSDKYRLAIFDRNSELGLDRYEFPSRYQAIVLPAIEHQLLLDIQRASDIGINLNSVQNSMTMFANRAIELQAMGTVVFSNYNAGLNSRYPHVFIVNSYLDVVDALNQLDAQKIRRIQNDGIRAVYSQDLAQMKIARILESVGIDVATTDPRVGVVLHSKDETLSLDVANQTYQNVVRIVEATSAKTLHEPGSDAVDVIVHFDSKYRYSTTHIEDLVNGFRYTDALTIERELPHQLVEKATHSSHQYQEPQNFLATGAEFVGHIPQEIEPRDGYRLDDESVQTRDTQITLTQPSQTRKPILSVVIPIYNNGRHLYHKCYASLQRSSMFDRMELILVDDGSSDSLTHEIIARIAHENSAVKVFKFPEGGSGSASRPRNKGLELAESPYVTYLDPDNEAVNDGYAKLLSLIIENNSELAIGNMSRWRNGYYLASYVPIIRARLGVTETQVNLEKDSLIKIGFTPMSIQALVAKTDWLKSLGLEQPVGAVGQDSFFFQQMIYYAKNLSMLDELIHTYYGEVESSVVNTVNPKFFRKYLPLERARSEWLREIGLLEDYKQSRFEPFFTGWFLKKLEQVPLNQRAEAEETVVEIANMYGELEWTDPIALEFWDSRNGSSDDNGVKRV